MLQHRTRAGVLPNPCNCGFLENQPIRLPGLKPGVCSGLILSGTFYPDLKIGVWRRRTYQGLQRISLYVKSRFCLKTHVADSQRCRCKALAINRPAMKLSFILLAGTVPPPGFDIVFFATGGSFFISAYLSSSFYFRDAGCGREDFRSILLRE